MNFFKKHKIFTRVVFYGAAAAVVLLLAAELTLRYALPSDKIKNKITQSVSKTINGDFGIDKISAGLAGLDLRGVTVGAGGKKIASVKRVSVHFDLLALFHRQFHVTTVIIDGINANIIKDKNGKFNFEPLIPQSAPAPAAAPENQKKSNPLIYPFIRTLQISNSNISYKDEQSNISAAVRNLSVDMSGINLTGPFSVSVNAAVDAATPGINVQNVQIGLSARPDLSKEFVEIITMAAGYNGSSINLYGQLEGFENPTLYFGTETKKLVSSSFQNLVQTPEFDLTSLKTNGKISVDTAAQKITLANLDVDTIASKITANGEVSFGKKLNYKAATTGNIALDKTPQLLPMLAQFKPAGAAAWNLASENMGLSGTLTADKIGAFIDAAGTLDSVTTQINIKDLKHIEIPSLTGRLNNNPFGANLKININKADGEIVGAFNAKKVFINPAPEAKAKMLAKTPADNTAAPAPAAPNATLKQKQEQLQKDLNLPPLDLKASANIDALDAPFFQANAVKFNADISGLTVMLDQMRGSLDFSTDKGQIKDIYRLANSNALAKVLFMSVSVVSKVVNSLDILNVLKSIVPKGKTADQNAAAPADANQPPQKIEGKMDFDSFTTSLNFKDGKSEIKHGSFVSDTMSFKLSGNMDFNTRALDMTVNAAPGSHPEDGNMPLTIKIAGTIDNPQGSMSVLSSFTSLIKGVILNNPAANILKAGAGAVAGGSKDNNAAVPAAPLPEVPVNASAPSANPAVSPASPAPAQQ